MHDDEPCTSIELFLGYLLTGHTVFGSVDHHMFVKRFNRLSF